MDQQESCFTEAHFCVLPAQSNIYGMCHYSKASRCSKTDREKVLVACLNGDITLFEYVVSEENELKPVHNQFRFQYIPGKAEIVSIDAFTKNERSEVPTLVLGVTFIDQSYKFSIFTAPLKTGIPFYTTLQIATGRWTGVPRETDRDNSLSVSVWKELLNIHGNSVVESGMPDPMDALPCQVTHAQVYKKGTSTTVFLVSTADKKMHLFKEHFCKNRASTYKESKIAKYFPEFDKELEDSVFFLDILYYDENKRRLTCTGSQCGYINCYTVDVTNRTVLTKTSARGLGPVTSIVLFTEQTNVPLPDCLLPLYQKEKEEEAAVHVLVCHALEVTSVYRNVSKNGLADQIILEQSYNYDSVLCACVADIDFDGKNEIILGTFGQRILAYKFDSEARAGDSTKLLWEHSLQYPIHSLLLLDMTGDGLKDLAVLSMRGLHILQNDVSKASGFVSERILDLVDGFDKLELQLKSKEAEDES